MEEDMEQVWIEAAQDSFDAVGEVADRKAVKRLAGIIEEMASMIPNTRREYAEHHCRGAELAAAMDWITDSE